MDNSRNHDEKQFADVGADADATPRASGYAKCRSDT